MIYNGFLENPLAFLERIFYSDSVSTHQKRVLTKPLSVYETKP